MDRWTVNGTLESDGVPFTVHTVEGHRLAAIGDG